MSEFEIDKLFRQKLAGKKVSPSNEAWKKLSSEIGRSNQKKAWPLLSAAASVIVVLGMAVYFLIPEPIRNDLSVNEDKAVKENVPDVLNDNEQLEEATEPTPQSLDKEQLAFQPDTEKEEVENNDKAKAPEQKHDVIQEKRPLETSIEEEVAVAEVENIEEEEFPHQILKNDPLALADNANDEREASHGELQQNYPGIKIIYKSSDNNKGKLQEDKPAFRKVVALARDIKEADIGLGTLREAKNELMAFGYKKTKELGN